MDGGFSAVVTTVAEPTVALVRLAESVRRFGGRLVVVGDRKGPSRFSLDGAEFYSIGEQKALPFRLSRSLPEGHYARKNIGYLLAMASGAGSIYETDDDNFPGPGWKPRSLRVSAVGVPASTWCNVYLSYTTDLVWPRGFPLDCIREAGVFPGGTQVEGTDIVAPIQQGLVDGSPDVDAIWRMVLDKPVTFRTGPSLHLPVGTWCPFNSQSTWWWQQAFPLLYLPSHCSFRMTDIWRSFVAQRCLWETGHGLVFHPPEAIQVRNVHDLLKDFQQEIPGYLHNGTIAAVLQELRLEKGPRSAAPNMTRCYGKLVETGVIERAELPILEDWLADIEACRMGIDPLGKSGNPDRRP